MEIVISKDGSYKCELSAGTAGNAARRSFSGRIPNGQHDQFDKLVEVVETWQRTNGVPAYVYARQNFRARHPAPVQGIVNTILDRHVHNETLR